MGKQRIPGVDHHHQRRIGQHQQRKLPHKPGFPFNELGKHRQKKENRLRVGQLQRQTLQKTALEAGLVRLRRRLYMHGRRAPQPGSQIDEISRPRQLQDRERQRRSRQHRTQRGGRDARHQQGPESNAQNATDGAPQAIAQRIGQRHQHTRPRAQHSERGHGQKQEVEVHGTIRKNSRMMGFMGVDGSQRGPLPLAASPIRCIPMQTPSLRHPQPNRGLPNVVLDAWSLQGFRWQS